VKPAPEPVLPRRVLVVEDSRDIADLVALHLRDMGSEVVVCGDGAQGLHAARQGGFDLIVLDVMLPGLDGVELTRRLRAEGHYTPILMVTARSAEVDRVLGLEVGADDYIVKPFAIRELLARVGALTRRAEVFSRESGGESPIVAGDLAIDSRSRAVTVAGKAVDLTAKEFDLLWHFARNPGRVYTRQQLLDLVWGHAHDGFEHTVNSHINRLRAKIERDPRRPDIILTVWGVGYKFGPAVDA
jgi:DNA-binding response OmpR family regulator